MSLALTQRQRDQLDIRAYAVRSVLQGTDKLLGLDDCSVIVVRPGKDMGSADTLPPAWTDGRNITINGFVEPVFSALKDGWTEDDIFVVTALNYHELAHCFFMPRLNTDLMQRIRDDGYWQAWNILQDMHDETLFVGRFRPSRNYFIRIATEFFKRTKQQEESNYLLVAGRRFLPDELRDHFRDAFTKPDIIADIDRIADAYVATVYPRDEKQMYELVKQYHELMNELQPEGGGTIRQVSEHREQQAGDDPSPGHAMVPVHGKPVTEQEQERAGDQAKRAESDGERRKGPGEGKGTGQGDNGAQEGSPRDTEASGDKGGGAGTQSARPTLDELLDDASSRVTEEVAHELGEKADALDAALRDYQVDIEPVAYRELTLDDETADAERSVDRALRRLREEFDPGWHHGEDEGRLDFKRLVGHQRSGRTDVFRRWDAGVHDVLDIESVIAVDLSGSMSHLAVETGKALWTIHTALRNNHAQVTVLGYNTDVFLLRQRGDDPETFIRQYGTGGGTQVVPAILEAGKVFAASPRPMKLLFLVTDGHWYDQSQAHTLLDDADYQTFIVGLGMDVSDYAGMRSVQVARTIHSISELPELCRDIVTSVARARAELQRHIGRA